MITLSQAYKGRKVFHLLSLWEKPQSVTIENIKLIHNENRFFVEYRTQEGNTIQTDVNTSFTLTQPKQYR